MYYFRQKRTSQTDKLRNSFKKKHQNQTNNSFKTIYSGKNTFSVSSIPLIEFREGFNPVYQFTAVYPVFFL